MVVAREGIQGTRVRLSRRERREQLLDVAADLVVEAGIDSVTMEGVAARGGVSKALPYSYFENSDDLVAALFDREMAGLDRAVGSAVAAATTFEGRIRGALSAMFDVVAERGVLVGSLLAGRGGSGPLELRRNARDHVAREFFGGLIHEEYGIATRAAENAASIFLAAASTAIDLWVQRRAARRELTDSFVTLVVHGLEGLAR